MVKVIWHKAASLPHTNGSVVFARLRQCAPHLVHQSASASYRWVLPSSCWVVLRISTARHVPTCPGMCWAGHSPSKLPLHMWWSGPYLIHGYLAHPSPHPKRHLDRFSRFCRAHDRDRPTDRPTERPRYSMCNNWSHLRSNTMRPNNNAVFVAYSALKRRCWLQVKTASKVLRQGGYVIVVVCLFVCLLATLRKNFWMDLY